MLLEKEPLVSIVVPAFNAESTINRCLDSLLGQTYKNIEVLVVNDGSKDKTLEIVRNYSDKRLKVFTQENRGISATRNCALEMVNGEYVAFCDSDDFYEHDYLEKMMFLFDKNVCMVACDFTRKAKPEKVKTKITQFSRLEAMSEIFCDKYLYGYIHTKIFRKEYLKDVSFDADVPLAEDLCFLWQYLKSCPENNMILHTNEKLYHYMPTKGSLSSLKLGKKFNEKRLVVLNRTDKMIEECKIFTGGGTLTEIIKSWQFLILVQFLFETKFGKENKILHKHLKIKAKGLYKYYQKHKKRNSFFRRQGWIYKLL